MKFGVNLRKGLTGAEFGVRVFQIVSLLPLLYILAVAVSPAVITKRSLLSFLFDLGVSAIPRAEALALSALYRASASEVAVYFAILLTALAAGLAAGRLLKGKHKTAVTARKICAALIAADLVLRLLPLRFNKGFGLPAAALGFALQLGCLILIVLDLRADKAAAGRP